MLRFSHMVPSCLLKEGPNLPDGCWDLDPAATPEELLQGANHVEDESHAGNNADEHSKNKIEHRAEAESTVLPGKSHESVSGVQVQDIPNQAQSPPEPPPGFPVVSNQAQNPPEPPPGFPVVITDIQNRKEACQTEIFSSRV
nr:chaperone protein DnaJ 49 [Ipomoea batatas]